MESRSNSRSGRKWCNLPSDILLLISQKLDENHDRQLRAVCTSWNSSLPKSPSAFPLQIPCPIIIPSPEGDDKEKVISLSNRFRFYAVERSVILVSPLNKEAARSPPARISNVEETGLNKRSLFCPLCGMRVSPCCCDGHHHNYVCDSIDMLDFCVTEITKAYSILWVDTYTEGCYHTHSCSLPELYMYLRIKKLIAYHHAAGHGEEGVIVLLALRLDDEKLAYWKSGCEEWKIVDSLQPNHSRFVDIICFDAKFCAVDFHGNLVMIDPLTIQPIESVPEPYSNEYSAISAYLVQCEKHLYLVKIVACIAESDDQWEFPPP